MRKSEQGTWSRNDFPSPTDKGRSQLVTLQLAWGWDHVGQYTLKVIPKLLFCTGSQDFELWSWPLMDYVQHSLGELCAPVVWQYILYAIGGARWCLFDSNISWHHLKSKLHPRKWNDLLHHQRSLTTIDPQTIVSGLSWVTWIPSRTWSFVTAKNAS